MGKNAVQNNKVVITGGEYSGLAIDTPGGNTHPMGMRERLAIFNMIQDFLPGAKVMDICAGSGALGIEALSRGAESALFIDNDESVVQTIEKNLFNLQIPPDKAFTLKLRIERINIIYAEKYDVIFVDPPYDKYKPEMITSLESLVTDGGIIVASTPVEGPEIPGFEKIKARKYARCLVTIYQKK